MKHAFCIALVIVFTTTFSAGNEAKKQLVTSGVRGGLVVHLGCGDGKLTAELGDGGPYLVHGLDANAAKVAAARKYINSLGKYGKVSVEQWGHPHLPYADNTVNLLIAEKLGNIPKAEVMRVLVPEGVAIIGGVKTVKPRPGNIGEWTHFLHGADGNAVAKDTVVAPPRRMKWQAGPRWERSHGHLGSISAVLTSGGRVFYIADEGPIAHVKVPARWRLIARDAFNGVLLWKRKIGIWESHIRDFRAGPSELPRRIVVDGDTVYAAMGYGEPVQAINAADGKTIRSYEQTKGAVEIIHSQGILYVVTGDRGDREKVIKASLKGKHVPAPQNRAIVAVRAKDATTLWTKSGPETKDTQPLSLASAEGRVIYETVGKLVCLEATTGKKVWEVTRPEIWSRPAWSAPTVVISDGVVLIADRLGKKGKKDKRAGAMRWGVSRAGGGTKAKLTVYSLKDGSEMWSARSADTYNSPPDVFVIDGLVWTSNELKLPGMPGIKTALDLKTGKVAQKRKGDSKQIQVGMAHHRCYRNKATSNFLLLGRAGIEYLNVKDGSIKAHHWVRGTCQYGVMPGNGLTYAPPHECACYVYAKLDSFNALAPATNTPLPGRGVARLVQGSAPGKTTAGPITAGDWPTHRHDIARSGATASKVGAKLKKSWTAKLASSMTGLTAVGDKLFVASRDTHMVYCLDSDNGKVRWTYTAEGPVDSPPTIAQGLCFFGSSAGYVYCLNASDGALVWRFRAGPGDRRLVIYDRLESAWPVNGSVLVHNGEVVFAAGRSSYLDGGIRLIRLEARTGKLLSEESVYNYRETDRIAVRGMNMEGALLDVLSCDGKRFYMRHIAFDLQGRLSNQPNSHLFGPAGFLDDTWQYRTYWTLGTVYEAGYGGWFKPGNRRPSGRIMSIDAHQVYSFGRGKYSQGQEWFHGESYQIFAAPRDAGSDTTKGYKPTWTQSAKFQVRAMAVAGDKLLLAGPLGTGITSWEEFTGGKGVVLRVLSTKDGSKLAEYPLPSMPVWDGLIVAGGRVYISTEKDGIICMVAAQ